MGINLAEMILEPESLAKLDLVELNDLPIYVFSKNAAGAYTSCNNYMAKELGFAKGTDVIGATDDDLSWRAVAPRLRSNDSFVIKSQRPCNFFEAGLLANGVDSTVLSCKWPLQLQNGKIAGVMCLSIPVLTNQIPSANSIDVIAQQYHITPRQKECLSYLVKGMTIKEIAHKLSLSPRTIEHYLEALKDKLNCHSRSQLIAMIVGR